MTKKAMALEIQKLVKENKVTELYYAKYFHESKTPTQMCSGIDKEFMEILLNRLNKKLGATK